MKSPVTTGFEVSLMVKTEQKRVNWVLAFGFPYSKWMWSGRAIGVARKAICLAFAKTERVGEGSRFTSKR